MTGQLIYSPAIFLPQPSLLAKIGTIVALLDEKADRLDVDWLRVNELMADREVQQWLDGAHKAGLLQVKP